VFSLGLILVVIAGAELFTGNNLIVMALASRKVTLGQVIYNWVVVYLGNFVGAVLTAYLIFLTTQYTFANYEVGKTAINIANAKCKLAFAPAFFLGLYCNALVCLAVWICLSARTSTDKILSILFPITAFVAGGFEHSIANMYFLPIAYFIKDAMIEAGHLSASAVTSITWHNIWMNNLLPVTLGNIVGGGGFVGIIYWFIYSRPKREIT
jgi:formate/nitrite transporter